MTRDLRCSFQMEGTKHGPFGVLDLSPTGVGVETDGLASVAPGTAVEELEVTHGGRSMWLGEAVVVHAGDGRVPRLGLRVTSTPLDLRRLRAVDELGEGTDAIIAQQRQFATELPANWRAKVAQVRRLLRLAEEHFVVRSQEAAESDTLSGIEGEDFAAEALYGPWSKAYFGLLAELYEESSTLTEGQVQLARRYAHDELWPHLHTCSMHRRAHDKPRGYSGDYLLITMYFAAQPFGDNAYARFLSRVARGYSLSRTLIQREQMMREELIKCAVHHKPTRVVSLASGPAIEIERFLATEPNFRAPMEIVLLDQDEEALRHCHERLTPYVLRLNSSSNVVSINYLHFSVRQLLKPSSPQEVGIATDMLGEADLIYSAGLFDYLPDPVAKSLTNRLFELLGPGGRLFIGNLDVAPDTTWIMDYVLSWHLQFRNEESMLTVGSRLAGDRGVRIRKDPSGYCIFLEVERE